MVVGGDTVDHFRRHTVFSRFFRADERVRTFHFMVNRLADVVQQAAHPRHFHIRTQFRGDDSGEMRRFDGVQSLVLPVTGAVFQSPQQFDDVGMQSRHIGFISRAFARLFDGVFHFGGNFFQHFLNSGGMNAPVVDENLHRLAGNFAPHRVKRGQNDGVGGIVNHHFHAGSNFKSADISPLPPDDAPFHIIVGQRHSRNGCFCHLVRGDALNCQRDNFAGFAVGFRFGFGFHFAQHARHILPGIQLDGFQQFGFCLFPRHSRNPLQLLHALFFQILQFVHPAVESALAFVDGLFALFDIFHAPVERFLPFLQAFFLLGNALLPSADFSFGFILQSKPFFFCLNFNFFAGGFSLFDDFFGGCFNGFYF